MAKATPVTAEAPVEAPAPGEVVSMAPMDAPPAKVALPKADPKELAALAKSLKADGKNAYVLGTASVCIDN